MAPEHINGLHLWKSLIKDGCEWHGDIVSKRWSECLYFSDGLRHQVEFTLEAYTEGTDYKLEDGCIWIA